MKAFFYEERNEEVSIIAAETVLELFLEDLGSFIYNKSLDEVEAWPYKRMEGIEIDYNILYK